MFFKRKKQPTVSGFSHPRLRPRVQSRRTSVSNQKSTLSNPLSSTSKRTPRRGLRGFFAKLKRPFLLIVIGVILISITHTLFISPRFNIEKIAVTQDGESLETHPLLTLFQEIKDSNIFLFNADPFYAFLLEEYPEYESIQIKKTLPDTLLIELTTYPKVANLLLKTSDNKETYFLLNSSGRILSTETQMEGLPLIVVEREQSIPEGTLLVPQDQLAFILDSIQTYEDKFGMKVTYALYLPIEREVHLFTERNFYVWLDLTLDLDEQLTKLKLALSSLNIYEESIDYIDLRIEGVNGEKIIFKRN